MPAPIYTVDAFTARAFAGNPAAVCLLGASPVDDAWMQAVAREMNLSETAFVRKRDDGDFDLRWFTPAVEVDLCGHATLASAHVLWEAGRLPSDRAARFHTRSGLLTAVRVGDDGAIAMDFPAKPATKADAPSGFVEALGVRPIFVGSNRMDYLVEVEDEAAVRAVRPDLRALKAVAARGIIVTARSRSPEFDFVSRFFAPASGVDEDPVTGSAHCCLGPFWGERLGKNKLVGYQASARGGVVGVEVRGARVVLSGSAVTVARGEIIV
jgi:PhzF family phenazine biosynthesis protein